MRVMMDDIFVFQQDNLSFPLICPDWNADEEMLLLEVFNLLIFFLLMLLKNLHLISIVLLPLLCRVLKCMALVIGPKFLNMWEQEEGNSVLTTIMLYI